MPYSTSSQIFPMFSSGIASSGGDCSIAEDPGIFEDVSQYTNWIKTVMITAGYPYEF